MSDAERFVEKFSKVWASPEPDEFQALWAEEGTLLHPGMKTPIPHHEIPDYVRGIKRAAPDISLRVERWAASDDFVLIEWEITATVQGEPFAWSGVDRFTLQGDRAIEGIAYFDSMPLWERVDPSIRPDTTLEEAAGSLASEQPAVSA